MSTLLSKLKVATGRDSSNNFDLSCFHATTSSFYSPRVTYFHEFVPGEKWNMDARCSVRCLPMDKPTIADVKIHNRFFFVPYYSIMEYWNEFLSETPISNGSSAIHPVVPVVSEEDLIKVFTEDTDFAHSVVVTEQQDYDFKYSTGALIRYYEFTSLGRTAYSILNGLGYCMNFHKATSTSLHTFSALPLLAYLKVYMDWYRNTAFDSKLIFDKFFKDQNYPLNYSEVADILRAVTQMYLEKDYFTSSTLYPIGTNSSTMQLDHNIPDITRSLTDTLSVSSSGASSTTHGTPIIFQQDQTVTSTASKYSIDAVNALTDYVKRHQLAGIQPFNRILAEYGVTLDNEILKRSIYIGDVVETLDIQEVESTSYADDTILGELGGRANGGQKKNLDFKNDNFGCIICVTTIVPRTSYVDGVKRHCLRKDRFDFFTPSVEHLGTEPVYVAELVNRFDGDQQTTPDANKIFGYMPRYAAYKTALDTISGDFAVRSRKSVFESWILQRKLDLSNAAAYQTISEDFLTADQAKVSNMFASQDFDNFIIFNMYHVNSRLPMHQLWDDYQWSNEDNNPQHVTIANQGVQFS